jgi:methoxymalonate biosynthesis acyl carrier protein
MPGLTVSREAMPRTSTILRELNALFSRRLHIEVPSPDTDLIESGLLDSLQLVELLLNIEQDFGCRIPVDEVELDDLRSLGRLARLVASRTSLAAAA